MTATPDSINVEALTPEEQMALAVEQYRREEASSIATSLGAEIVKHRSANSMPQKVYEGKTPLKDFGINTPKSMRGFNPQVPWGSLAVHELLARIDFGGWSVGVGTDPKVSQVLDDVYDSANVKAAAQNAHKSALIRGVSFVILSDGDTENGEPEVRVDVESANTVAVSWDKRAQRVTQALLIPVAARGAEVQATVITDDYVCLVIMRLGKVIAVGQPIEHSWTRCPVYAVWNDFDAESQHGHSLFTEPMRSQIASAKRAILSAEIAREFHSLPARVMYNVAEELLIDENGDPIKMDQAAASSIFIVPAASDGSKPEFYTWETASISEPVSWLRACAVLFSSESGVPISALWQAESNPTSAEAQTVSRAPLAEKANVRIIEWTPVWKRIAKDILSRLGLDETADVQAKFSKTNPLPPTVAADYATKVIASGIMQPNSDGVLLDTLGYSNTQAETIREENGSAQTSALISALSSAEATAAVVV